MDNEAMIPTMDEFIEQVFSLSPVGNAEVSYVILCEKLGQLLPTKQVLTFELLTKRYKDYLAYIKPYNDVKEKQYIKKDKTQKPLSEYLYLNMFESDYSMELGSPNDGYLFGIY